MVNNNVLVKARTHSQQALSAYFFCNQMFNAGKSLYSKYREKRRFIVSVPQSSNLYYYVQRWALTHVEPKHLHTITVDVKHDYDTNLRTLARYYDAESSQEIMINDLRVKIYSSESEKMSAGNEIRQASNMLKPATLKLETASFADHQKLLQILEKIVLEMGGEGIPRLFTKYYNEWRFHMDLPPRSIDTVVLKTGQLESILRDVDLFLNHRELYVNLGVPYHRGYLLHGVPGTGKTSLIKAIGRHFNLSVYYVSLSEVTKDSELMTLISQIPPKSILLLEDIDSFNPATSRDAEDKGLTTSGLLNALDGVATPDGLMVFMTTNHIEKLDPALKRTGRVDFSAELSVTDEDQFKRIVETFTGQSYNGPCPAVSPAAIVEIIKENLDTPHLTIKAIEEFARGIND